ncbi:hypothetical protein BH10BAC3_BH10BAC3_04460 [soil metagenome]
MICSKRQEVTFKGRKLIYSNIFSLKDKNSVTPYTISIYPIPVTDVLNIAIAQTGSDKITFSIIDLVGRSLQNTVTHAISSTMIIQLDVSTLPAGFYFLKILWANGKENMLRKFVKE